MIGGKMSRGYTIVEVLIFMAVSSSMFLFATNFINGKQGAAEFKQGMTDMDTRINAVLNDVANGIYPSSTDFNCSIPVPTDPTSSPYISKTTSSSQGANNGCVFLGKVIQFAVGADKSSYNIYSVTARQSDIFGSPIRSFAAALPVALNSGAPSELQSAYFNPNASSVNLTEKNTMQFGLTIDKAFMCVTDCSAGTPIGMIGFFGSLGNYGISTASDSQSGAQSVLASVIPLSSLGEDELSGVKRINTNTRLITDSQILGNGRYVVFCYLNGTRKGSITLGGSNSQQLTTQVETGQGVHSVC